jgi:hypothetical protein
MDKKIDFYKELKKNSTIMKVTPTKINETWEYSQIKPMTK